MTHYVFHVQHGSTVIPVNIDSDDDIDDAAIQAAAAAAETMRSKPFEVTAGEGDDVFHASFSASEIEEWWA